MTICDKVVARTQIDNAPHGDSSHWGMDLEIVRDTSF